MNRAGGVRMHSLEGLPQTNEKLTKLRSQNTQINAAVIKVYRANLPMAI